jgi:acyl phosphate:glycerol-3-phosphate acyltransferase
MVVLVVLLLSYLAGSIPFGLLLTRIFAHRDVREAGSGNIGATNVARVAGKRVGLLTLVLDALKGAMPVVIARHLPDFHLDTLPPTMLLPALAGLAALVGHCYPVWLRFRGGKGVATGLGVIMAFSPPAAGVALAAFAVVFAVVRKVSAASLVAAPVALVALALFADHDRSLLPLFGCLLIIIIRHADNIRRLRSNQELSV